METVVFIANVGELSEAGASWLLAGSGRVLTIGPPTGLLPANCRVSCRFAQAETTSHPHRQLLFYFLAGKRRGSAGKRQETPGNTGKRRVQTASTAFTIIIRRVFFFFSPFSFFLSFFFLSNIFYLFIWIFFSNLIPLFFHPQL